MNEPMNDLKHTGLSPDDHPTPPSIHAQASAALEQATLNLNNAVQELLERLTPILGQDTSEEKVKVCAASDASQLTCQDSQSDATNLLIDRACYLNSLATQVSYITKARLDL